MAIGERGHLVLLHIEDVTQCETANKNEMLE